MAKIFKICTRMEWSEAESLGVYRGSEVDLRDGFIHFSTSEQVDETRRRHFAGQADLLLVEIDGDSLGEALRWEPSRGGALFPHLYGPLPVSAALRVTPLD